MKQKKREKNRLTTYDINKIYTLTKLLRCIFFYINWFVIVHKLRALYDSVRPIKHTKNGNNNQQASKKDEKKNASAIGMNKTVDIGAIRSPRAW